MKSKWLLRDRIAVLTAIGAPVLAGAVLVPFRDSFANTDAALVLVAVVVGVAATGSRLAGYVAAASSAAWFDFFLTHPYGRFSITRHPDVQTTVLLMVIGIAVTELAVWGRRQQAASSRRAGYLNGIYMAAEAATTGAATPDLIGNVTDRLIKLLELRECRFQFGVAGMGVTGRLHHDGSVTIGGQQWPIDERELPPTELELLVEGGERLRGRFVLTTTEGARPPLERRLVAIALADQVAAALAADEIAG